MRDIGTMVWKEGRDTIFPGGRLVNLSSLVFIALLGIVFPLIDRVGWLTLSVQMVLLNLLFPFFYILVYMGDSLAGERERHTLETLLASRMSDRAILWGKVISNVGYIWGMTIISSLLSVVVVNLAQGQWPWTFYTQFNGWLIVLVACMLGCLLAASGGILVSLHSATTRQAQQILLLGSLGLFIVLYLVFRALPSQWFQELSGSRIFLIAMLVTFVLDAVLLAITLASFRRSHLIED